MASGAWEEAWAKLPEMPAHLQACQNRIGLSSDLPVSTLCREVISRCSNQSTQQDVNIIFCECFQTGVQWWNILKGLLQYGKPSVIHVSRVNKVVELALYCSLWLVQNQNQQEKEHKWSRELSEMDKNTVVLKSTPRGKN